MSRIAVFGYGSLVSPRSAARTLGRPRGAAPRARLEGWRRRWSQKRDNLTCEKTFARRHDGHEPTWVLGLNVEPEADPAEAPGGILIPLDEDELERFDVREVRYERVDVTEAIRLGDGGDAAEAGFERVITYSAKPEHFAPTPPEDAIILSTYAREVAAAFEALGDTEHEHYRRTTGPHPVAVVDCVLVRDRIPAGNPREW